MPATRHRRRLGCLLVSAMMLACSGAFCLAPLAVSALTFAPMVYGNYPDVRNGQGCAAPLLQFYSAPGYAELRAIHSTCGLTLDGSEQVLQWYQNSHWRRQFAAPRMFHSAGWQLGWLRLDVRQNALVLPQGNGATRITSETRLTLIAKRP